MYRSIFFFMFPIEKKPCKDPRTRFSFQTFTRFLFINEKIHIFENNAFFLLFFIQYARTYYSSYRNALASCLCHKNLRFVSQELTSKLRPVATNLYPSLSSFLLPQYPRLIHRSLSVIILEIFQPTSSSFLNSLFTPRTCVHHKSLLLSPLRDNLSLIKGTLNSRLEHKTRIESTFCILSKEIRVTNSPPYTREAIYEFVIPNL